MNRDHLEFLCNIGELSAALTGSSDIDSVLDRLVRLVARHLDAHVCSLYVFEEATHELVLRATVGLTASTPNLIRLRHGEGLVGTALEQGRPLLDNDARHNGRYRHFPGLGEEHYNSFIAVPLLKDLEKIGVLVVQREERNHFHADDVSALRVLACQLVSCIENARALRELSTPDIKAPKTSPPRPSRHRGKVASEGSAVGAARVLQTYQSVSTMLDNLPSELTIDHFRAAVQQTSSQLEELQLRVAKKLPEAVSLIFSAHLLMLKDVGFVENMAGQIDDGIPVGTSVRNVVQHYLDAFSSSKPIHIREKAHDVEDLAIRLAKNLAASVRGSSPEFVNDIAHDDIVIARDVYPSEFVILSMDEPSGFVLVGGGVTSHVAILARSLGIPLFITDDDDLLQVPDGTAMLLDDQTGNICVSPPPHILEQLQDQAEMDAASRRFGHTSDTDSTTADGVPIRLMANINLLREVQNARDARAVGIGLYRTEFPFMIRHSFPDEEEQYLVYRQLVQEMNDAPITFRTLDIGGDKSLSYWDHGSENNPELGLRAIRFSLQHPNLFKEQLRAILRAGVDAVELRIMFPMIASLDEFREAKCLLQGCLAELKRDSIPYHEDPQIGMMVELPSVLETAADFAKEVDFFSIGSNDFVQYMLAADRGNDRVDRYYCPHHPSVLRGLARFVAVATKHQRRVSVCGEMAQQPTYLPFLLGIGIRELSVAPHRVARLRETMHSLSIEDARSEAHQLLQESTLAGIEDRLRAACSSSRSPTRQVCVSLQ